MTISLTAGWEDFLKIQRDESVILEHTVLGINAPEASILVQNAPKSLAGGAYSAPPDPLAVMGWDGDLVKTFWGVNYVPPCLWPVPPCCFEAGYGPGSHVIQKILLGSATSKLYTTLYLQSRLYSDCIANWCITVLKKL